MANLRRSVQTKSSQGLSPTRGPAPAASLGPPRKVIKALYDYNSPNAEDLSFVKGDFFHVVGNQDDEDWFEACNPATGVRGYVPVNFFKVLDKNRNSNQSLEENGNDSGSFTDPHPSALHSQQHNLHQGHHHQHQHQYQPHPSPQRHHQPFPLQYGHSNSNSLSSSPAPSQKSISSPILPKCQPLYGIVLYDFGAERPDELDAKIGDAILVIAQSNEDWYLAKPIGRLGGPGLIPINFVEIRDMATNKAINVQEYLRQTGTAIPRVEEWKKQAMEYRAKSIPLGRLDGGEAPPPQQPQLNQHPQEQHHHQQQQQQQQLQQRQPSQHPHLAHISPQQFQLQQQQLHSNTGPTIQQLKNKMSRDMKSYGRDPSLQRLGSQDLDIGRRMAARDDHPPSPRTAAPSTPFNRSYPDTKDTPAFQHRDRDRDRDKDLLPSAPSRIVHASVESFHHEEDQYWFSVRVEIASGSTRNLFRLYEDFYDFHIALLEEFPVESGRVGDQPRILPFMPIPLQVVNDAVSASRRTDLDRYVQDLCRLPPRILQHPLVEGLFSIREGDTETAGVPPGSGSPPLARTTPLGGMAQAGASRPSQTPPISTGSSTARPSFQNRSHGSAASYRHYPDDPPSAGASPSLRSQASFPTPAHSNGSTHHDLPGPKGGAPSEEFIKVKISFQEDIMAMRIPVSITFKTLQQKIFDRLRADHKDLSYRDDRGNFAAIQSDADVRDAIDRSGGKLMIYVD